MSRELSYTKRYSFKNLGDAWKDCYVEYRPFNYESLKEVSDMDTEDTKSIEVFMNILQTRFVKGRVIVNDEEVAMESGDMMSLPVTEITNLIKDATGSLDPPSSETSDKQ